MLANLGDNTCRTNVRSRPLITVRGRGKNKSEVKTTLASNRDEIGPNIMRHMTRNDYGAVVAEAYDIETSELLLVATYFIGDSFKVSFEPDVKNPICVTVDY